MRILTGNMEVNDIAPHHCGTGNREASNTRVSIQGCEEKRRISAQLENWSSLHRSVCVRPSERVVGGRNTLS